MRGCRWCSNTAVSESKSMSPSKTHHKIVIMFLYRVFAEKHNIGCTIEHQLVKAMWPNMVFGHNLQHMAPFGIPTSGFCMVFQYGSLIFSTPEPIFGTPDPRSGSGRVPAGLGTFFAKKRGPEKLDFVVDMVPHGV